MFQNLTFVEFLQHGGIVFFVLLLCSIISIAIIVERLVVLGKTRFKTKSFLKGIIPIIQKNKMSEAVKYCKQNSNNLASEIFLVAFNKKDKPRNVIEEAMQRKAVQLTLHLNDKLSILATMGNLTPFVGLLGTVIGIIKTFRGMSFVDSYSPGLVTGGIAEALVNTAAGLFVAIPAVIAYNYFSNQIQFFLKELEISSSEVIEFIEESKSL